MVAGRHAGPRPRRNVPDNTARGARRDLDPGEKRALCRALATVGSRPLTELAEEWGVTYQSLLMFKRDHAREIDAIAADLDNKFAGLWIADKEARVEAYMREYMRLDQSDYKNHHEWSKARQAALRAVAEELGQLPGRGGLVVIPAEHVLIGVDVEDLK